METRIETFAVPYLDNQTIVQLNQMDEFNDALNILTHLLFNLNLNVVGIPFTILDQDGNPVNVSIIVSKDDE